MKGKILEEEGDDEVNEEEEDEEEEKASGNTSGTQQNQQQSQKKNKLDEDFMFQMDKGKNFSSVFIINIIYFSIYIILKRA
jgi:hypothetical protein